MDTEKIDWMRAQGVIKAQWSADGVLLSCELGPVPQGPPLQLTEEDLKALERRAEEEYNLITYGAAR